MQSVDSAENMGSVDKKNKENDEIQETELNTVNLENKADVLLRLRRIEGQVKGIYRMVDEGKCCSEVMVQVSAVRAAMNKVGGLMMDNYIKSCVKQAVDGERDNLDEVIGNIVRYIK